MLIGQKERSADEEGERGSKGRGSWQRINGTTRCRAMTMTKSTELTMMKVTTTMALNDRQT